MKKIKLTQNKFTLIDDNDFEYLSQFKWQYQPSRNTGYAIRTQVLPKRKTIRMHIELLGVEGKTDHINGNGLDNRRKNLRRVTDSQNSYNTKIRVDNTSGFKGVSWAKAASKWKSVITVNKKLIYLGIYKSKHKASQVYKKASQTYHGEYARV